jgi:hypothetical protein
MFIEYSCMLVTVLDNGEFLWKKDT